MRFISIILLLSLCFQFLFKTGVAGYYVANRDYIAKVLCINKDNTAMHCDGKCYLKKKMQEAGDENQQSALRIKYEPIEFLTASCQDHTLHVLPGKSFAWAAYTNPYACIHGTSVFHPPC